MGHIIFLLYCCCFFLFPMSPPTLKQCNQTLETGTPRAQNVVIALWISELENLVYEMIWRALRNSLAALKFYHYTFIALSKLLCPSPKLPLYDFTFQCNWFCTSMNSFIIAFSFFKRNRERMASLGSRGEER